MRVFYYSPLVLRRRFLTFRLLVVVVVGGWVVVVERMATPINASPQSLSSPAPVGLETGSIGSSDLTNRQLFPALVAAAVSTPSQSDLLLLSALRTPQQSPTRAIHFGGGSGPSSAAGSGSGTGFGHSAAGAAAAAQRQNQSSHSTTATASSGSSHHPLPLATKFIDDNKQPALMASPLVLRSTALTFGDSPLKSVNSSAAPSPRDSVRSSPVINTGSVAQTPSSSPPHPTGGGAGNITPTHAHASTAIAARADHHPTHSSNSTNGSPISHPIPSGSVPPPSVQSTQPTSAVSAAGARLLRAAVPDGHAGPTARHRTTNQAPKRSAKKVSFDSPPPHAPTVSVISHNTSGSTGNGDAASLAAALNSLHVNVSTPISTPQQPRHHPITTPANSQPSQSQTQPPPQHSQYHAAAFAIPLPPNNQLLATPIAATKALGVPGSAAGGGGSVPVILSTPTQPILYNAHHMNSNANKNKHRRNLSCTLTSAAPPASSSNTAGKGNAPPPKPRRNRTA